MHRYNTALLMTLALIFLVACAAPDEDALSQAAQPLATVDDIDVLLEQMEQHDLILLGESTHGTQEFYEWRRIITQRLIEEQDIGFIAVEGDWGSIYRLHEYVIGTRNDTAESILRAFSRWPEWMWNNNEILELAEWLREYNEQYPAEQRVGFFGMDVYGAENSLQAVKEAVEGTAVENEVHVAYACFAGVREFMDYVSLLQQGVMCADEAEYVVELVKALPFVVQQHAHVVKNAERHFRAMIDPSLDSWNERVYHMNATVYRLHQTYGRGIIWAHNTHVGDARATAMVQQGQVNIGQLFREQDIQPYILGFGTYTGSVRAGLQWGAPGQVMHIPRAMSGSYEDMLSRFDTALFLLKDTEKVPELFTHRLGHRAIGVVYNPLNERGNYVPTILAERYDAFIFIKETRAIHPIR